MTISPAGWDITDQLGGRASNPIAQSHWLGPSRDDATGQSWDGFVKQFLLEICMTDAIHCEQMLVLIIGFPYHWRHRSVRHLGLGGLFCLSGDCHRPSGGSRPRKVWERRLWGAAHIFWALQEPEIVEPQTKPHPFFWKICWATSKFLVEKPEKINDLNLMMLMMPTIMMVW